MARMIRLAILAFALFGALAQTTVAVTTHVVGDSTGWVVPPSDDPLFYAGWAAKQTFFIGDILLFNFSTGSQDVARVSKEAFFPCNSTNPIFLEKTGPAKITLNSTGEFYFIGTFDNNCFRGQKLAINVTTSPGPTPSPTPRTKPENFTVGDRLGWVVPPLGEIAYITWAYDKTFIVGDHLVFNFYNETDDVAVVSKEAYDSCNTSTPMELYNSSPAVIKLTRTGEHYFTSTYDYRCDLGQKLAINVTGSSTGATPPSSPGSSPSPGTAKPPSSQAPGPSTGSPVAPGPSNAAPNSRISGGYMFIVLLPMAMGFLH
ncbi:early nodulin-like protein 1 isoform X1 [Juglans microcarpa x Juglans regia]|uniref:early nodulin-like protein 1 isoform X1 n=1 Tax=Juglans microcarpa x Juglans regia TaxID=2249226 RepID=UPI001B7E447C|nr:early nodulin-like protein 1 isoform X1 [Juglans microcarpa x Juglans regia]